MRKPRFRLQSLLILVTISCVAVALTAFAIQRQKLCRAVTMQYHEEGIDVRLGLRDDIRTVQTWNIVRFGADRLVREAPNVQEHG